VHDIRRAYPKPRHNDRMPSFRTIARIAAPTPLYDFYIVTYRNWHAALTMMAERTITSPNADAVC
jgi:quinolinate synthase